MAMKKATELQLKLLICIDGETESQRRGISCSVLVSARITSETTKTQILLYNSAYFSHVFYMPSQVELAVKEKQHSLLYTFYLGHNYAF